MKQNRESEPNPSLVDSDLASLNTRRSILIGGGVRIMTLLLLVSLSSPSSSSIWSSLDSGVSKLTAFSDTFEEGGASGTGGGPKVEDVFVIQGSGLGGSGGGNLSIGGDSVSGGGGGPSAIRG